MSKRYVSLDRVRGLRALRRSSAAEGAGWQASLLENDSRPVSWSKTIARDSENLCRILGATPKTNEYGEYLSVRCWCAQPPRYSPDLRALKLLVPDAVDEIADPEQWLFLDTETTGLAGGSGTYAFLVGIAWWEGGGLEIEQFFLREYSEERSLLFALRERIAEHPVLVTFNGKSFDWPLLETRYRMSRKISMPSPRAHLDFLHPARNLWRLRLGSVRLSELERHILGWDRGADVLSGQIPQIYFDYLRGGAAERLVPVLNHNQMDLRGLAALSSRILSLLNDAENLGQDGLELFGVSRICEKRGEHMRARKLYEKSIASFLPTETDRAARRSLARLAKRDGDFDLACELWKDAVGNSRHGYDAYEQLAKYYEHNARNPEQARQVVLRAISELRRASQVGDITPGAYREFKVKFDRRLERLERKSRRPLLDMLAMQTEL
ncbi:MAG TPA: ribonuclease H-like domain-containing protein [Candidatus Sulfotelmatobacter sp.]|nr:ribonuclease H-like domain-containing protein [Candidatus Sulfotelmatobacter sp.]